MRANPLAALRCACPLRGNVGAKVYADYTANVRLEWSEDKAARNQARHGVTFAEAASVFLDPLATIFDDEWHSEHERREIIVGQSGASRLLVVSFVERDEELVRIVSARPATKRERKDHEENPLQ